MWMLRAKSVCHLQYFHRSLKPPWLFVPLFSYSDEAPTRAKAAPVQETRMRDRFMMYAKGGDGGSGCCSIHRSRHLRRGRPDGGNGGRGGDVILECSPTVWDFRGLQHHVTGGRGGNGAPKNMIGTRGEDKVVQVPVGTVIHLKEGEIPATVETRSEENLDPWELPGTLDNGLSKTNHQSAVQNPSAQEGIKSVSGADDASRCADMMVKALANTQNATQADEEGEKQIKYNVAELTKQGQKIIIATGGEGGLGNVCCPSLSRKRRGIPDHGAIDLEVANDDQFSVTAGSPGSEAGLILELKSIADVGLVGMPNAGKSTLLGAISRAGPKVGHYAFTTLRPNLGNLNFDDISITVADIPGLIKGAHVNRGLGHAFLRHIERTKVLAYVVDLAYCLDGGNGIPPWEQLRDLILELEHHQEGLSDRPSLVVANKIDEDGAEEVYKELEKRVQDISIYPVCAVLEEGVPDLKVGLRMLVSGEKSESLSLDKIHLD